MNRKYPPSRNGNRQMMITDHGAAPFVVNIDQATAMNQNFRAALWTGENLQLTLMSLNVGEDIGFERHPYLDQLLKIEQGRGVVMMGQSRDNPDFQSNVEAGYAIFVPAGTWHNLMNTGNVPLKLYSVYAPPQHPKGTVHKTKAEAITAEHNHER